VAKSARVASIKRQAIHHKATEKVASLASLRGKAHFHFCIDRECRLIYGDACEDASVNGRCHLHRGSLRRPLWISARDPQECCIGNCVMVGEAERLVLYKLAGPGPWFQCQKCYRAHGWTCA
jgi:hypothetical protein